MKTTKSNEGFIQKNEKVSVVIPVYNAKDYIEKCVTSILNQTYKNIECILIDDGSTDGSDIVCDKLEELDSRIIVRHKKNGGTASARNMGIELSNGEYISFIDADDYIDSVTYERVLSEMEDKDVTFVAFGMREENLDGSVAIYAPPKYMKLNQLEALEDLFGNRYMTHSSSNKV